MESFESSEEKSRNNSKLLPEPDEDGFITVTHTMPSKMVGSKRELEVNDCTSLEKGLFEDDLEAVKKVRKYELYRAFES
jgi:hypothetical protein